MESYEVVVRNAWIRCESKGLRKNGRKNARRVSQSLRTTLRAGVTMMPALAAAAASTLTTLSSCGTMVLVIVVHQRPYSFLFNRSLSSYCCIVGSNRSTRWWLMLVVGYDVFVWISTKEQSDERESVVNGWWWLKEGQQLLLVRSSCNRTCRWWPFPHHDVACGSWGEVVVRRLGYVLRLLTTVGWMKWKFVTNNEPQLQNLFGWYGGFPTSCSYLLMPSRPHGWLVVHGNA